MSVSKLENRFLAMEEDFDKIIASSKATLQKDKEALQKSPRNARSILKDNRNTAGQGMKDFSLDLGGYEKQTPKQKELREERQKEYREYLAEHMSRNGRSNTNINADIRSEEAKPISRKEEYRRQIDQEYNDLLKKKQEQEKTYRVQFHDDNADKKDEVIVLDSRDSDLIELLKSRRRGKSAESKRSSKFKEMRGDMMDYGRANSVPPNVPPMLGGNSNTQLNKQKQQQYKLDLEEQMKENQLLKAKEKLKRLGRVTSDVDVAEIELPKNSKNKWALPVHNKIDTSPSTASINKSKNNERFTEKESSSYHQQQQQQQYPVNNIQQQPVMNPFYQQPYHMGGMQQPGIYQAPTMQPMGMNPLMQWQMQPTAYQPMMQPDFNNSGGAQQFIGNPYMQGGVDGRANNGETTRKSSARSRKHWDVPTLDLDGSMNRNQNNIQPKSQNDSSSTSKMNIPRRPNVQPPGGSGHNLFNSPANNNNNVGISGDETTQKRMKQLQYQKELQLQMEIKKEKEAKAKREHERYEQKLEREIQSYDPWGREGAGAPVRNKDGQIVANLKNYQHDHDSPGKPQDRNEHQQHQEFHSGEEESPMMKAYAETQNKTALANTDRSPNSSMNAGQNHKSPKTYARGAALKELKGIGSKSPRDQVEQDEYKSFLQKQVEEKQRKAEEAKEKARIEEEKEAKRIEEQQRRMKEEYEREKELQRQKEEEVRKKNEELKMMAEKKRFEEEAKQKQIEAEMEQELKRQAQLKLQQQQQQQQEVQITRSDSPPIPTVAKQQQKRKERERRLSLLSNNTDENEKSTLNIATSEAPNIEEARSATRTTNHRPNSTLARQQRERQQRQKKQHLTSDEEYLNTIRKSMEVQQQINETNVEQQNHLIKQLANLRSQLQQQERKIKNELQINEAKYSELKSAGKPKANDIFNKATKKSNQASPNKEYIPSNYDSSKSYGKELDYEQQRLMRQQEERLNNLRKKLQSDKAEMKSSSNNNNKPKYSSRGSAKSLLDSESQFISLRDHQDITDQVIGHKNPTMINRKPASNSTANEKNTRYSVANRVSSSARARRREKEKAEMNNIFQEYFPSEKDIDTSSTFDIDRISMRNEERLKSFKQKESSQDNENESQDDADDIVRKFMNQTTFQPDTRETSESSLPSSSKFYNT